MQGSYSSSFEKFSGKKRKNSDMDFEMKPKRVQGNKHRQARKEKSKQYDLYV